MHAVIQEQNSQDFYFFAQAYFVSVIWFCHLPEEKSAHTPL